MQMFHWSENKVLMPQGLSIPKFQWLISIHVKYHDVSISILIPQQKNNILLNTFIYTTVQMIFFF